MRTGAKAKRPREERCGICNCLLNRSGEYAKETLRGRSHATMHHFVAERFFGRSKNRPGSRRDAIFAQCPWDIEGKSAAYCYECHELLLHNPVLLPEDLAILKELVRSHGFDEDDKPADRQKIAGRIALLHEVIAAGLRQLADAEQKAS